MSGFSLTRRSRSASALLPGFLALVLLIGTKHGQGQGIQRLGAVQQREDLEVFRRSVFHPLVGRQGLAVFLLLEEALRLHERGVGGQGALGPGGPLIAECLLGLGRVVEAIVGPAELVGRLLAQVALAGLFHRRGVGRGGRLVLAVLVGRFAHAELALGHVGTFGALLDQLGKGLDRFLFLAGGPQGPSQLVIDLVGHGILGIFA